MEHTKRHRRKHHSDHRDNREKLKRSLRSGLINFFLPIVFVLIISLAHQALITYLGLWIVRSVALAAILWCIVGFFMLMNGLLLWLRIKAG
ncbi:MAG TPA: hypothetical protein PL107_00525 [Candidatus Marinimicrobia bacterium]|jgi:uncharacterized membrane protein YjjP (DUF1212 family)|nr:hypothetical protein [Candidatus Neomarinimicrobiota bacterium]